MYHIKIEKGISNLPDAVDIRTLVFVEEQGFVNEFDEHDDLAYHMVVYHEDRPIATARAYSKSKDIFVIGRVAVIPAYRGKQIGRLMVDAFHKMLLQKGIRRTALLAQTRAQGFYEKLGYVPVGNIVDDEGCPHIHMEYVLDRKGFAGGKS